MAYFKTTIRDYDSELSSVTVNVATATALTTDAQAALCNALRTAIDGVSLGVIASSQYVGLETLYQDIPASLENAQRETKWLCFYHATADPSLTRKLELPCANLALLATDSSQADTSHASYVAFKAAFEALVKINGTYAVALDKVVHKGANL